MQILGNGTSPRTRYAAIVIGVCAGAATPLVLRSAGAQDQVSPLYRGLGGLVVVCTAMAIGLALSGYERRLRTRGAFSAVYWLLALLALIGSQMLWSAQIRALAPASVGVHLGLGSLVFDIAVVLVALAMAHMARTGRPMPAPGAFTMAVVAVGLIGRVAAYALPVPRPDDSILIAVGVVLLLGYANVALLVSRAYSLAPGPRARLWALMLTTGLAVSVRGEEVPMALSAPLMSIVFAVVALVWSVGLYVEYFSADSALGRMRTGTRDDVVTLASPGSSQYAYDQFVPAPLDRAERERLHEVRSTVAGIRAAADLSDDAAVDEQARLRLRQSMRSELDRLTRLVSEAEEPACPPAQQVDLDEQLCAVTDTHRARGHAIEWAPSGTRVLARPDDVRVALNILLENTAVHAHGASSRIEVSGDDSTVEIRVSDDGPGIAPHAAAEVFEWGVSGDQRGSGIGLSMAQRLLAEQGGSLTLVDAPERGATFAIRLPAVRVPMQRMNGADCA